MFGGLSMEELGDPAHAAQEVTTDTVPVAPFLQSTNTSQVLALTEVDRRLDECILAKYCLYEDLQEIEDAIVLELVRYCLDQANADVLAFLMNTSIELVADMCTAFSQSFKDCLEHRGALFKATFAPTDMNWTALDQYPQSRMELILTISLQVLTRTGKLDLPPGLDKQFDPDCDYFELHGHDQYIVDTSFVAGLLTSKKPQCDSDISGSFAVDLMTSAIELFQGPAFAGVSHFPPLDVAFAIRLRLLSDIILKNVEQYSFNVMSDTLLAVIAKEDKRSTFWATTAYRSTHIGTGWSTIQKMVDSRSHATQGRNLSRKPALRQLIRWNHVFCCWNAMRMEMTFAQTSLFMIDASTVVKGLAQLWNLLEE